jgi:hypothetical protein
MAPEPHRERMADACFDAALARALLAQTRAGLCGCGVRVATCPSHREAAVAEEEEADV